LQSNNIQGTSNNSQYNQQDNLFQRIKSDLLINGLMGGAMGDGSKFIPNTNAGFINKTVQKTKNFGKGFGRGFVGGVITSPQASVAMYAGDKATKKLKEYYLKNDDQASLLHAGMIAVPSAIAGTYGFGAMMHGSDNAKHLFTAKNKQQRLNAIKNLVNPIEHFKRGIHETKDGFKAFNLKNKMGVGSRLMKGFNLLGLGIAAYQAYDYYKKKKEEEKNKQLNKFNYIQKTAGLPIYSSLKDFFHHRSALKKIEHNYGKTLGSATKEYQEHLEQKNKALGDVGYEAIGLGLVGYGSKMMLDKFKHVLYNNEPQTQFTY